MNNRVQLLMAHPLAFTFHKIGGAHALSRVPVGASPTGPAAAKRSGCCPFELAGCGEAPPAAREARALPRETWNVFERGAGRFIVGPFGVAIDCELRRA